MTIPVRVDSVITTKIYEHYKMLQGDIDALSQQITQHLTATYRQTINAQLRLYSCQKSATGPDASAQKWIDEKAIEDSTGIATTYNRELKNKISRLRKENRRGNRFYYLKALDSWIQTRNAYKIQSIALNTMTQARAYAQDRFIRENKITGRFVMVGPPPVCRICIRIKAKGPLTWEECMKPANFVPAHVHCPHRRQALVIKPIKCDELTWTG